MINASTHSRSATRSLWMTVINLFIVVTAWGWAAKAIAQVYQIGDVGPEVAAIQQALNITADGTYGDETAAAVSDFQLRFGLEVDGQAGPDTLRALNLDSLVDSAQQVPFSGSGVQSYGASPAARSEVQVYQIGDSGPEVTLLQQALLQQALPVTVDGIYGTETANAVSDFQRLYGLRVNGIAGPETLRALNLDSLAERNSSQQTSLNPRRVSAQGYGASPAARYEAIANRANPYVVAIPGDNVAELLQVRRLVPQAEIASSRRGAFIRAERFQRRSDAERLSRELRQAGFDARIAYRP